MFKWNETKMRGTPANYLLLLFIIVYGMFDLLNNDKYSSQVVIIMSQVTTAMFISAWALYSNALNQNIMTRNVARGFRLFCLFGALYQVVTPYGFVGEYMFGTYPHLGIALRNVIGIWGLYALADLFRMVFHNPEKRVDRLLISYFVIVSIAVLFAINNVLYRYAIYLIVNSAVFFQLIFVTVRWSIRARKLPHICMQIFLVTSLLIVININHTATGEYHSPWFTCVLIFLMINAVNYRGMKIFREIMLDEQKNNLELIYQRDQIKPHFMYNTLTAIITLIRRDNDKAVETIHDFSHLLRGLAREGDKQGCVKLQRELEVLESYIKIQRIIMPVPLEWEVFVESSLYKVAIPVFTLQTLIENAIKHALREGECLRIGLKGHLENDKAVIILSDNGHGIAEDKLQKIFHANNKELGLINTSKRLQQIGGALRLENIQTGLQITIELPVIRK